eukprot:941531-Amphidinium_carterae.1
MCKLGASFVWLGAKSLWDKALLMRLLSWPLPLISEVFLDCSKFYERDRSSCWSDMRVDIRLLRFMLHSMCSQVTDRSPQ